MGIALIIFDILIILGFALAIFRGYRRGILKTSILGGVKVALLILLLIFSFSIAEAGLNIQSLPFTNGLKLSEFVINEMDVPTYCHELITSVIKTVVRVGILIVGLILIHIISPIIRLILKIVLPFVKRKSAPVLKWAGAIVGGVYYIVTFCILTLPIYGILEITNFALEQSEILMVEAPEEQLSSSEDEIIVEVKDALDSSFILKATSNIGKGKNEVFGVGAKSVGSYLVIKTDHGRINLIKEVNTFYKLSPVIEKFVGIIGEENVDINELIDSVTDEDIDDVISVMKDSVLIKNLYDLAPEIIYDAMQESEGYKIDVDLQKIHDANIENEFDKIGSLLKLIVGVLKEIDLNDTESTDQFIDILDNEETIENIASLIDKLFDIVLVEEIGAPLIIKTIDDALTSNDLIFLVGIIDKDYLQNELPTDFSQLIDAYKLFEELKLMEHFDSASEYKIDFNDSTNETKLKDMFTKVLTLKLIDGYQKELILYVSELANLKELLPITDADFENLVWAEENIKLTNLFVNIVKMGSVMDKLNENMIDDPEFVEIVTLIGITFDSLYECNITKNHAFNLLENLVTNLGYEITFDNAEREQIIVNTGEEEFKLLAEVIKEGKTLAGDSSSGSFDINNVSGEDVTNLMLKASEGIIASKVAGTILNDLLGPDGIGMNPVDENGNHKYDFRDPNVLKNEAISVGTYIELHKKMNNINVDDMNSTDIEDVKQLITNLGNEGNNNVILEDILNTIAPTTEVEVPSDINWSDEASIVADVLTAYNSTNDGEIFDINEYPDLAENVESSTVVQAILEYLQVLN